MVGPGASRRDADVLDTLQEPRAVGVVDPVRGQSRAKPGHAGHAEHAARDDVR